MTWFHWLIAVLALVGVIVNIRKHPACFAIWAVTNLSWTFIDLDHGLPSQAALQFVYFCLSLYGLYEWTRKNGGEEKHPEAVNHGTEDSA